MKKLFTTVILSCSLFYLIGQNTYFTRTGHIYFISKTDVINIDANNYLAASFFNLETGKVQVAMLIKSFEFTLATAKEHFNESYMESDKHPKALFKGNLTNFDTANIKKKGKHNVTVKGEITIHGVTKTIEVPIELDVQNELIFAKSEFQLSIDDFKISVPKLVENRVAKQVSVKIDIKYSKYKKNR